MSQSLRCQACERAMRRDRVKGASWLWICPKCGANFTVELDGEGKPGDEGGEGDGGATGPSPNDAADNGIDDAGGFSFHRS